MIGSISAKSGPPRLRVPGVYYQPQRRTAESSVVRTDVAGFVGFEPRLRDADVPSRLLGDPPVGHDFRVAVSPFQLVVGGVRGRVPGGTLPLSRADDSIPLAEDASLTYAVTVIEEAGDFQYLISAGPPAALGVVRPPTDEQVESAVAAQWGTTRPWVRIADVAIHRTETELTQVVHPALRLTRCDDWSDYLLAFGEPLEDGTLLGTAVQAFFINGGRRCYVATVPRPGFGDEQGLADALQQMTGQTGASELEATGLECLLLIDEVSFIDVPDLYSRRIATQTRQAELPGRAEEGRFLPCAQVLGPVGTIQATATVPVAGALFADRDAVFRAQRSMLLRCIPERWRVLLLLSVPLIDDASGAALPPAPADAADWSRRFLGLAESEQLSCAALYYPWLLTQARMDAPVRELPPTPFVAGILARRDLARGVQATPANEVVRGAVGLTWPLSDDDHGRLYQPAPDIHGNVPPAVNLFRAFPGYGVQLWGARTLSTERWLRYLSVRRCLSAIERRAKAALDTVAFEPNTPLLWIHVVQLLFDVLQPLYDSGALRGERPEDAFYVRCDESVNPLEGLETGRLVAEVGVAVAAPAEYLVFRVGRREGIVEVVE